MSDVPANPYADTASSWVDVPPSSNEVAATAKAEANQWVPVEQPGIIERVSNFFGGHKQYDYPEIGPTFGRKATEVMPAQ